MITACQGLLSVRGIGSKLVYLIVLLIRGPAQRGPRVPWLGFLLGSKDAVARYKAGHVIRGLKWPVGQAILFRWLLLVMLAGYAIWIAMIVNRL